MSFNCICTVCLCVYVGWIVPRRRFCCIFANNGVVGAVTAFNYAIFPFSETNRSSVFWL